MKYLVAIAACLSLACHSFGQRDPNPSVPTSSYGRALIRKSSIQAMRDYLSITNGGGGGGTNGGGGGVISNAYFSASSSGAIYTNAGSNFVFASVQLYQSAPVLSASALMRFYVDTNHDGTLDPIRQYWWSSNMSDVHFDSQALVAPGASFQWSNAIGNGAVKDLRVQLSYVSTNQPGTTGGSGGSGSAFDGNITNGTARGYLQFVDGVTVGAKITPTNSFFDTGNNLAVGTNNASGAALNVEGTFRVQGPIIGLGTNQWVRDATNVNNSLYGVDSEAMLYSVQHSVSNYSDVAKIGNFFRVLRSGNLLTNLVDFQLLRSNLNSPNLTNATTWAGRYTKVYGASAPLYDSTGVTFGHLASHALWLTNFPDVRTNTTFVQAKIQAANWADTNPTLVMQNGDQSTSFGAGQSYLALGVINSGNSGVQWRQGNGSSYTYCSYADHHRLNGLGIAGTRVSDYPRVYVVAVSNTTWQGWLENIPAGAGNVSPVMPESLNVMTTPLTNIFIGGRLTGSSPPFESRSQTVSAWLVFNIAMSQTQVDIVNRALRCLDPEKQNVVFYGDSRMAGESFDFGGAVGDQRGAYANQLMNRLGNSDSRFYNMSAPGITIDQQQASSNLVPRVLFYAPDGVTVTKTKVFLLASAFNQFSKASPPTVLECFAATSNLCAQIKRFPFELHLFTEAPITTANYSTNTSGQSWTNFANAYNTMLVTNVGLCDFLHRYDLVFKDWERLTNPPASYFTDGIHASAAGNSKWADFTARQLGGQLGGLESVRGGVTNLTAQSAITLTFRVPFPNTNYTVTANGSAALAGVFTSSKTPSNCVFNCTAFTGVLDWMATLQTQ